MRRTAYALGAWLSAALDDPNVCAEMKRDINAWFDTGMPFTAPLEPAESGTPLDWLALLMSAKRADWGQVVMNGGPPCFAVLDGKFCLRAQRWAGHPEDHAFVSLESLLGLLQQQHQDMAMNLRAAISKLTSAQERAEKVERDAARYRWLRVGHNAMLLLNNSRWVHPEQLDERVDYYLANETVSK
jgi:hypothetical protein